MTLDLRGGSYLPYSITLATKTIIIHFQPKNDMKLFGSVFLHLNYINLSILHTISSVFPLIIYSFLFLLTQHICVMYIFFVYILPF